MRFKNILFSFCALFLFTGLSAQSFSVSGKVIDAETQVPLEGVVVTLESTSITALTDKDGRFTLKFVPNGPRTLVLQVAEHEPQSVNIELNGADVNLGTLTMVRSEASGLDTKEEFIPTITLSDDDLGQEIDNQNISGVLSASRDVFFSAAAFTFGPARFRIRGYDSENTTVLMNGIPVNELESGRVFWGIWGGLNDVMRNRDTDIGLEAMPYTFGGVGGGTSIDTRAFNQRKQLRLTYSRSNRTYANRLMATWSTGPLEGDWAVSLSGSRRWGDEGFIEGTFYDAWSYFLSVDKKFGDKHALNLTAFGAPSKRGRSSATVQEMYDLADNNYYNPNWGYQNGKKRNSRVADSHQPMIILRHDWQLSPKATLTTAASYQFGKYGSSALDWFDAPDPRPDYYRYLPSFFRKESDEVADYLMEELSFNENNRQIQWDNFFEVNRNSQLTDIFPYLIDGQKFEGNWSQYIVEERRFDSEKYNFYSNYQNNLSENATLHFGLSYQQHKVKTFKVVQDLLGGDFYVNVDRFSVRDSIRNFEAQQNDLNNPGEILEEGDVFGYNYDINIRRSEAWLQGVFTFSAVDFFLGLSASRTDFWRTGHYRTGRFPDNSFGDSEKQDFFNYGIKAGLTYKITGRHYLFANGAYLTRAPFARDAYVSPRTRDQLIPGLTDQKITSAEAGYYLRSPNIKGKAAVYFTRFEDQVDVIRFYNDIRRTFGNYILTDLDKQHTGIELAVEAKLPVPGLSVSGVAAIGQYLYTSRAKGAIYQDNIADLDEAASRFTVYTDGFYIPSMPQSAYTAGLSYNAPQYWFANLNFNYFDDIYIDFNPVRRTEEVVFNIDPDGGLYRQIIEQEKVDPAFTIDFFGGKSFKFGDFFMYLNIGVNNILDNRDFITGGYEQLRFDVSEKDTNTFPPRYYYSFGRNYFINISFRY